MTAEPLPLFPVTTVGSWPRPAALLAARRAVVAGRMTVAERERVAGAAVEDWLALQEEIGIDVVTDGEQRRDNFYSFVAEKLEGVRLMSLAEMLDVVEDREGFERLLRSLDVPAYAIFSPTCVGRVSRRVPLALDELAFVKERTTRPVKVPLPGPYLLTRAMWLKELSRAAYPDKEALADDVCALLSDEIDALAAAGADFIQLDEPVLTEVAFNPGGTRTFMCAALASRADPAEELDWAVSLINRTLARVRRRSPRPHIGLHVCRGNWSVDEATLLAGAYHPLAPWLARLDVDQLVLEFATPRAGELTSLLADPAIAAAGRIGPGGIGPHELGLGVVNPRTQDIETVDAIVARVREALGFLPAERIWLNPDCGFATFASRPMNAPGVAERKLAAMVGAAERLRGEVG
jgi:5-methyltetrahydropteroyltriglutamate--homocysteine methyltransferase